MGLGRVLRNGAMAAVCTAAVMGAAIGALYVTWAPKFVSLAIEPVSLLLLPGFLVGMAVANKDDLSAGAVMVLSGGFYLGMFWWWFWRRGQAARPVGDSSR